MLKRALLSAVILFICSACSSSQYSDNPSTNRSAVQPDIPDEAPDPAQAGERPDFVDPLTGLQAGESTVNCRPVAVVINNHHKALPQSGIGQAAICYEVLAEGNITRIVAIFHDFNTQKIGPVRSARPYFLDFAMEYDAILVHHGGSPQAYDDIEESGIADLDGMKLFDTFWRDPERVNIPGMFEHSSYTGEALIRLAQEKFEFRPAIRGGLNPGFLFYEEPTVPDGAIGAEFVFVPFAADYGSGFEYKDGLYYKYLEDEPQIDAETGSQLSVSNVLIQYAPVNLIPGDKAGRREAALTGGGGGLLVTRGGCVPAHWIKESQAAPTRWYSLDGGDLYFNKGKTWICVVSPETSVI